MGRLICCGEAYPEPKGCVVDPDSKTTEDSAKMAIWSQDSLEYAREHDQPKLVGLLKAVRVEVELEEALLFAGGAPRLRTRDLLQEREGHA
jgi:hypothetical protein